jgi:hypothetical protein
MPSPLLKEFEHLAYSDWLIANSQNHIKMETTSDLP